MLADKGQLLQPKVYYIPLSANYNWLSVTGFLIYCYSQSTVKSTEHNECVKIIPLRKYAMCLAAINESQKEIQATVKTSDLSSVKMIIIYSRKGITAAFNDISVRQARQANRPLALNGRVSVLLHQPHSQFHRQGLTLVPE